MKSAIETIRELHAVSQQHPAVIPFLGAILELDGKFSTLEKTKQDKPEIKDEPISPQDITSGNLMGLIHKILTAAGEQREAVAINILKFLRSLQ